MGSVWEAEHLSLKSRVAVKCLSDQMLNNAEAKARFEREALAAAQIRSPHVVAVLDHGFSPDGTPFMVLEMLEGEDLSKKIEREGRVEPAVIGRIVSHVCKALSKAHSLDIVHRDIKPDNVFLTDVEGELFVKILDFGIAKRREDHSFSVTSTGVMIGTPYYMSPEQVLSSKHVDFKADLWSLAVVAYHGLTGVRPFDGETIGALCIAIDRAKFKPVTSLRPELPPALDRFFERALCRDPEGRFASARELELEFLSSLTSDGDLRLSMFDLSTANGPSVDGLDQVTLSGQQTHARAPRRGRRSTLVFPALIVTSVLAAGAIGWQLSSRLGASGNAEAIPLSTSPPAPSASASSSAQAAASIEVIPVANIETLPAEPRDEAKRDEKKEPSQPKKSLVPTKKVKDRGF